MKSFILAVILGVGMGLLFPNALTSFVIVCFSFAVYIVSLILFPRKNNG